MIELDSNTKKVAPKIIQEDPTKNLEYQRKKDREPARGIFRNFEVPGGSVSFVYKEYKNDPVETYVFVDGEVRTIPRGVAKHLNKRGWYPVHQHLMDENGKASTRIGQKVKRFAFQSLEFIDDDEFGNADKQIITVEKL